MLKFVGKAIGFAFSALILIACALALGGFLAGCVHDAGDGSGLKAYPLPNPPGFCDCPSCDCACKGHGGGLCHCSLESCDCPCDRCYCTPEGCKIVPRFERAEEVEGDPLPPAPPGHVDRPVEASVAADPIAKPSGIECPHEVLAGDVEQSVRLWYRNLTNPGSCVQCSIGMCGCAQNVPNASLLLWPTEFGPAELHGSYPSRVADYARKRNLRIYNVTGSKTYEWMKWACRNGRPCAVGCNTSHFQTLFGHDPRTGEWYVVDNNSPQRIDVYSDAEFRSRHRASGEWAVILDYPPAPTRAEVVAWWAAN